MIQRYIVSGPGRVGGHIMLGIIKSADVPCLHSHNPWLKTDDDTITALIQVDRRDIFAAVMSNCLVWKTGQSNEYPTRPAPSAIPLKDFHRHYAAHIWYHRCHDLTRPFGRIEKFYFEDFVNDHELVLNKLGLEKKHNPSKQKEIHSLLHSPAPYKYQDVVLNVDELKQYYNYLQSIEVENPLEPPRRSVSVKDFDRFE